MWTTLKGKTERPYTQKLNRPEKSCSKQLALVKVRGHHDTQHNDIQQKEPICGSQHKWQSAQVTVSLNDTHHNLLTLCWVSLCTVSLFIFYYAECHYAECHNPSTTRALQSLVIKPQHPLQGMKRYNIDRSISWIWSTSSSRPRIQRSARRKSKTWTCYSSTCTTSLTSSGRTKRERR